MSAYDNLLVSKKILINHCGFVFEHIEIACSTLTKALRFFIGIQ